MGMVAMAMRLALALAGLALAATGESANISERIHR